MGQQILTVKAPEATNGVKEVGAAKSEVFLAANGYRNRLYVAASGAHDAWLSLGSAAAVEGHGIYLKAGNAPIVIDDWNGEITVYAKEATSVAFSETHFGNPTSADEAFKSEAPKPPMAGSGFETAPSTAPGAGE
jgi:hypothetical protein